MLAKKTCETAKSVLARGLATTSPATTTSQRSKVYPTIVQAPNPTIDLAVADTAAPPFSPSILSKILWRTSTPRVPLSAPFPGVQPLGEPTTPTLHPATFSTLPNGIRVVSIPSDSPVAHLGVFVDAGSRYETPECTGISHFLEYIAFKGTTNRSEYRYHKEMSRIGANIVCHAGREHFSYSADVLRDYVPQVLGTFADLLSNPLFDYGDIELAKVDYKKIIAKRAKQPDIILSEAIHQAAYQNNTVGLPLIGTPHDLSKLAPEMFHEYAGAFFTPDRIVISVVGVDHKYLEDIIPQLFDELNPTQKITKEKARYTGGEMRIHVRAGGQIPNTWDHPDGLAHFSLAFESGGWHEKDLFATCVLQMIMGGGGSFSAGGPGKGMYTRLYENVLNPHAFVESATSFLEVYSDTGIFGLSGFSTPENAEQLVYVLVKEAHDMAGAVNDAELKRAKNRLKSSVWMQLEQKALQLEDIGRQGIVYGKIHSAADICKQIDAVTGRDIQRVAQKLLSSQPSIAGYGDLTSLPRSDLITRHFGPSTK